MLKIKYIKNNSVLDEEDINNNVFLCFLKFIDGMLFFRSLDGNAYLGIETGSKDIQEDIIERGNVIDLEQFLNKAGIDIGWLSDIIKDKTEDTTQESINKLTETIENKEKKQEWI